MGAQMKRMKWKQASHQVMSHQGQIYLFSADTVYLQSLQNIRLVLK